MRLPCRGALALATATLAWLFLAAPPARADLYVLAATHFGFFPPVVLRAPLGDGSEVSTFVPSSVNGGPYGPGPGTLFGENSSLLFGPDGDLYIVSRTYNAVQRFSGQTGAYLGAFASGGGLTDPTALAFGPDGDLYVCDASSGSVLRYDGTTGAALGTFVPGGSGGLTDPLALAFGPGGSLYVSNGGTSVLRYDGATGAPLGAFLPAGTTGLADATALTFGPDADLYVGNDLGTGNSEEEDVVRYDGTTGASLGTVVSPGYAPRSLSSSWLAFGPDGDLYFNDDFGVYREQGGSVSTFRSLASLGYNYPVGLAFGPSAVPAVPEPGSLALLALSLLPVGLLARKRRKSA